MEVGYILFNLDTYVLVLDTSTISTHISKDPKLPFPEGQEVFP